MTSLGRGVSFTNSLTSEHKHRGAVVPKLISSSFSLKYLTANLFSSAVLLVVTATTADVSDSYYSYFSRSEFPNALVPHHEHRARRVRYTSFIFVVYRLFVSLAISFYDKCGKNMRDVGPTDMHYNQFFASANL